MISHEQIQQSHLPMTLRVPKIQRGSLFQAKYHDRVGMIFQSQYPRLQLLLSLGDRLTIGQEVVNYEGFVS